MADKDKKKDDAIEAPKADTQAPKDDAHDAPKASTKSDQPAAEEAPKAPDPVMSFERWLASVGKRPHWKHGMAKFANTNGKKTAAQWAEIFKAY